MSPDATTERGRQGRRDRDYNSQHPLRARGVEGAGSSGFSPWRPWGLCEAGAAEQEEEEVMRVSREIKGISWDKRDLAQWDERGEECPEGLQGWACPG